MSILLVPITVLLLTTPTSNAEEIQNRTEPYNLKLLSVIFRHGDRTPELYERYPKSPFANDTFYPMGPGGLTNKGKRRIYNLGKFLRTKYDKFLGDTYLPNSLEARSTEYSRTKQCLQLVLSALYPPKNDQRWHETLDWQPIPTIYGNKFNDSLLVPEYCPRFLEELKKAENSPEIKSKTEKFRFLMRNLTMLTSKNISEPEDFYNLYHALAAEESMGSIPIWAKPYFPDGQLLDGINLAYEVYGLTSYMRKINGGILLRKMLNDMRDVKEERMPKDRKIFLYSGHESNIVTFLQVLNLFEGKVPAYASAIVVEFHEKSFQHFIRVLYIKNLPDMVEVLKIKGCEEFCPYEKFVDNVKDFIVDENDLNCRSDCPEINSGASASFVVRLAVIIWLLIILLVIRN